MTAIGIGIGIPFGGGALADPTIDTLIAMYGGGATGGALYDPSDAASMFQDRSATPSTPAANGEVVGTMTDLSGNGIAAIAPADANRGTLTQDGDLWYLACSGTALTHYYKSAWGSTVNHPFTIVIAGQIDNNNDYLCCGSATGNRHSMYSNSSDGSFDGFRLYAGSICAHDGVAVDRGVTRVYTGVFNGSSSQFRINGLASANTDVGTQNHTESTWGARFDGAQPLQGRIYFIMKIHRALTASEIAAAESVAASKCGITL